MMVYYKKIILLILLLLILSCIDNIPKESTLSVELITSTEELHSDELLIVYINIKNADSLFALSLQLNYDYNLFSPDSNIIAGNLFEISFPENLVIYMSEGEISVAFGEWDQVRKTTSGTACTFSFNAIGVGSGNIYLSSLHLIKKDGSEIDEANSVNVQPVSVTVIK